MAPGLVVAAVFAKLAWSGYSLGSRDHLIHMATAAVAYSIAVTALFLRKYPSRRLLFVCLAVGLAARVPLVVNRSGPAHDGHRYLWDARLQREGYSPYEVRPDDPAFDRLQTPDTRQMNNRDVPSPYPPGAQYFFRLATAFDESVVAIKVGLLLAEIVTVAALWIWLAGRSIDPAWTLVYAWHPVVIFETAAGAHLDALGVALLMGAMTALARQHPLIGTVLTAASVSIKFLPIVLLPAILRHVRWWHAAAGAAVLAALYLPFMDGWRIPDGAVGAIVDRFRFNQLAFDGMEALVGARPAAALAPAAGLAIAALIRPSISDKDPARWAWPMAVALMLSPIVYPWYLTWLIPFAIGRTGLPLLAWSLASIATYRVWDLHTSGHPWVVPSNVLAWEYGIVAAVTLAAVLWRPSKRRATA